MMQVLLPDSYAAERVGLWGCSPTSLAWPDRYFFYGAFIAILQAINAL